MSTEELVTAMRLGSRSPLELRDVHDLGRFGLGLKTASFSQARRLTVRTKTSGALPATRCWDLDHVARVDDWQLLHAANGSGEKYLARLSDLSQGTIVLWQGLDRVSADTHVSNDDHQRVFYENAEAVQKHLGVVFHLLMTEGPALKIFVNDHQIEPWAPFLLYEPATQILAMTKLSMRGHIVEVHPYILPHQSKISKAAFEGAAGPRGWNAHQGFYVYRNRRLLVPGDWLGLGWSKEENYKLARIRVVVPNALDHDWQIDVTKSRVIPPRVLRDDLRRIAYRTRSEAKRIYSHRGAKVAPSPGTERVFAWEPVARHDKKSYRLNRDHPLLKRALNASGDRRAFNAFLRLVEETVPYDSITFEYSEKPGSLATPFDHIRENEVREIMEQTYESLINSGYGAEDAINRLRTIWPFEEYPALLESVKETRSNV